MEKRKLIILIEDTDEDRERFEELVFTDKYKIALGASSDFLKKWLGPKTAEFEKIVLVTNLLLGESGDEGIECIKEFKRIRPKDRVIVWTKYSRNRWERKAKMAGADLFLEKYNEDCNLQKLIESLLES